MADRVAILSSEGGRRKRKALVSPATSNVAQDAQIAQQRQDAKAASMGKYQRTDTDTTTDEHLPTDNGAQDSVQTAYIYQHSITQHACHNPRHHQTAHEELEGSSGSEVEGPINDDKYIKGTRLIIGGWFQACRGCNEPTAHSAYICKREVPLCPRCQSKYMAMVTGCYPPNSAVTNGNIEPLHFWLPRLLPPAPRLTADQRREFCDMLVLRQDDAWLQLIMMS